MPEGPSIVVLREAAAHFARRRAQQVSGNSRLDLSRMQGRTLRELRSWGKHFLLCLYDFTMRVHIALAGAGLFGSWRIDERREAAPRRRCAWPTVS